MTALRPAMHIAPPTPLNLDLLDGERAVGWVRDDVIGFGGFADETEAAHAAWVAYRALARRLAPVHGTRPPPIDIEPRALARRGEKELILAGRRAIAALVRPGDESAGCIDSFAFEIRVPAPADELRVRAMGHLMYSTLHKSRIRWAMWRRAEPRPTPVAIAEPVAQRIGSEATRGESTLPERRRERAWRFPALPWRRAGGSSGGQRPCPATGTVSL